MADENSTRALDFEGLRCPKCGCQLHQIEISGIPIEKCPDCSGVWLDAGELELIYERERGKDSWFSRMIKLLANSKE